MWNGWERRYVCVCIHTHTHLWFWWVNHIQDRPLGRPGCGWKDSELLAPLKESAKWSE
jgi:hypothetical protein